MRTLCLLAALLCLLPITQAIQDAIAPEPFAPDLITDEAIPLPSLPDNLARMEFPLTCPETYVMHKADMREWRRYCVGAGK